MKARPWTQMDEQRLRNEWQNHTCVEVAAMLGRSYSAAAIKAAMLLDDGKKNTGIKAIFAAIVADAEEEDVDEQK